MSVADTKAKLHEAKLSAICLPVSLMIPNCTASYAIYHDVVLIVCCSLSQLTGVHI